MSVTERFLKYINIYTTSDPESSTVPSSQRQFDLANILKEELIALGVSHVHLDERCYLMGEIPSNTDKSIPAIGFIAHMDTAPDLATIGINPRIIQNYDGQTIILNAEQGIQLDPSIFPELVDYVGQDLIVTDGTTLLGADDKAGVAEIMTAVEYLMAHPEIEHGKICIGFTPDEEIGRGADHFDVKRFGADYAYTIDGGKIGELEYESFNAASARLTATGRNVHPGSAKNQMISAIDILTELHQSLPSQAKPQFTDGREGFIHLISLSGSVDSGQADYIIRDHDKTLFDNKKAILSKAVDYVNSKYPIPVIELELKDSYYNMAEKIEPVYFIVDLAKEAIEELGITPIISPIRGGTDGSRLSFMGLPCPNIFAGGHNFHGRYEYVPIPSMEAAVKVILKIIDKFVQKS